MIMWNVRAFRMPGNSWRTSRGKCTMRYLSINVNIVFYLGFKLIERVRFFQVSETENLRKNLAVERMIVEGCDILLDVNQVFVRQGEYISAFSHNLLFILNILFIFLSNAYFKYKKTRGPKTKTLKIKKFSIITSCWPDNSNVYDCSFRFTKNRISDSVQAVEICAILQKSDLSLAYL